MRWFVFSVGILASTLASAANERLAVLEFRGPQELGAHFLQTLSDQARMGALQPARNRGILVISRENQAVLLGEMGQQCIDDGACEVEIARNLQAAFVVSGELVELEGVLLLTLKVHETQKGALLATTTIRADRQLDLVDGVRPAAESIVREALLSREGPTNFLLPGAGPASSPGFIPEGKIGGAPAATSRSPERVVVQFESTPPGAVVQVDGLLVCQATPCSKAVEVGERKIAMQKERYLPATSAVHVQRGTVVRLNLEPGFGWLTVETEPAGLELSIDGKPAGKSPLVDHVLDPGTVDVVTSGDCWMRIGERVAIKQGEGRKIRIDGRPRTAPVEIHAEDARGNALEARVEADGVPLGLTPGFFQVPVCTERITVRDASGVAYREAVSLREGKEEKLVARFDLLKGVTVGGGKASAGNTEQRIQAEIGLQREEWNRARRAAASRREAGWIVGGIGTGLGALTGLFLVLGEGTNRDIRKGGFSSGKEIEKTAETGHVYNVLAWVFGIPSSLLVTTGGSLLFFSPDPGEFRFEVASEPAADAGGRLSLRF